MPSDKVVALNPDRSSTTLLPIGAGDVTADHWGSAGPQAARWLSILSISRNGGGPEDLAYIDLATEAGQLYYVGIAVADIVGKLQVTANGQAILTAEEVDLYETRFRAQGEVSRIGFKCVSRTDARAVITEINLRPI
ncbi:MAG: hypothetical protein MRY64_13965 [Hyphomonadaceae bacterium]|nr:hypothetical protein [Hyphomonadaceae bacterium]